MADIILEYIRVLIWPVIVLYVVTRYHRYFNRLIERFCEETEEISSSSLGITAKFRKAADDISRITERLPENQRDAHIVLDNTRRELIEGQISLLAKSFFRKGLYGRQKVAKLIYDMAADVNLDFILQIAKSESPGERVASGICLQARFDVDDSLVANEGVLDALRKGLEDTFSRVRYRYVQAVLAQDQLTNRFEKELRKIALTDKNPAVQDLARTALDDI